MALENEDVMDGEGPELEIPDIQGAEYTLEDFEAMNAEEPAPQDPESIKLEGDRIPERYRGRTLDDILRENAQLEQQARLAVLEQRRPEAPPAPKAPEPEPEGQILPP